MLCAGWGRGAGLCTLPERLKTHTVHTQVASPPWEMARERGFYQPKPKGAASAPTMHGEGTQGRRPTALQALGDLTQDRTGASRNWGARALRGSYLFVNVYGAGIRHRGCVEGREQKAGGEPRGLSAVLARCWEGMSPQNIPTCSPR